jgi:hypothetical protein
MIRVFTMASILGKTPPFFFPPALTEIPDQWGLHFRARTSPVHAELLRRTGLCSESLSRVIGGFVMRDFELLLDRWIKKSREWLLEE